MLAYLDGFWQNSCCLHNSANVISGESPLGWRSPKLLFLDFLFPLSSYFPRIVFAALLWLGHRRFSPSLSALCVRTIRPSRPSYPRHTSPRIPLPVRPRKMPSRPLGLNAAVAHAASKDSSFPPTFFLKLSY